MIVGDHIGLSSRLLHREERAQLAVVRFQLRPHVLPGDTRMKAFVAFEARLQCVQQRGALLDGESVRGFHGRSFDRGRVFPPIVERQPTSGSTACAMRSKPLPDGHPACMGLRSLKAVEYPCEAAGAAGIPLGTEVRRRSGCPRMIRRCSSAEFCYTNSCRFRVGMWRSLVARLLWEQDVAGSNPVIPTIFPHARF